MEDWDDDKLKDVVSKKHGEKEKKKNPTAIVSIMVLALMLLMANLANAKSCTKTEK